MAIGSGEIAAGFLVLLSSLPGCGSSSGGPGSPTGPDAAAATASLDAGLSAVEATEAASETRAADDAPAERSPSGGGPIDATSYADAVGPTGSDAASPVGDAGLHPFKGVANSPCPDLVSLGVSWYYNWTSSHAANCTASRFVPMIWGHLGAEQTATGIANGIKGIVSAGYDTVLGFNEPDNATQSNIAVATAISLWPAFSSAALRIGSPATQANTTGLAWFTSFMSKVNADTTGALRVDFIAAHWYGWNAGSCDPNAVTLEAYIKQIEAIPGNRPIWLTEWGCLNLSNPTAATVQAFYSGALAMFARHPRIERYAWYPWTSNNTLVAGGALTGLGTVFAAAPSVR